MPSSKKIQFIYGIQSIRRGHTDVGKYSKRGIDFVVKRNECHYCAKLASQGSRSIFGGGYLVSDKVAAERMAAERMAAERMAARPHFTWELSDVEREIIKNLG